MVLAVAGGHSVIEQLYCLFSFVLGDGLALLNACHRQAPKHLLTVRHIQKQSFKPADIKQGSPRNEPRASLLSTKKPNSFFVYSFYRTNVTFPFLNTGTPLAQVPSTA